MYWDSSVVFTYHALIAFFVGNQLAAGLSTFAVLFPSIGFLLAVGYLVPNYDLVALAGITAYLTICPIT